MSNTEGSSSVTETTSVGWLQRIVRSIAGVFVGIILVIAAIGVLFWNEGRAVTTATSLTEGAGLVVSVPSAVVDPANDGKLVHTTGATVVNESLTDAAFGITAKGLRLARTVEMYQWTESSTSETRKTLGGGEETVTTYTYRKDWSSSEIDSSGFHTQAGHQNPGMRIESTSLQVPEAAFGAFVLSDNVLGSLSNVEDRPVTDAEKPAIAAALGESARNLHIAFGKILLADDVDRPKIGDLRIGYGVVPAGPASIVAEQSGNSFTAYRTKAGDPILLVENGIVPAKDMFDNAQAGNVVLTWIVRVAGFVGLWIGFALVAAPLSVVADVVPFFGSLVGLGTTIIAFVLAVLVSAIVVGIAWFFYRPLLALGIIAVGALVAFAGMALIRARARKAASVAA